MQTPDEWWESLAPSARAEVQRDDIGFARRFDIRLPLVKAAEANVYNTELPEKASFRIVGPASPESWRHATEKLAYYFKRQLSYDFPPYVASEVADRDLDKDRVLVFIHDTVLADWEDYLYFVGAVGIRWCDWENAPASWTITWAWLHPYERRAGYLSRVWPFLLQKFPNFRVEAPISEAMIGFLRKINYEEPEPKFLGDLLRKQS